MLVDDGMKKDHQPSLKAEAHLEPDKAMYSIMTFFNAVFLVVSL